MVRIWGLRDRFSTAISTLTRVERPAGDIAVVINGTTLDTHLVSLGCTIAKRARRKAYLLHIIEVPRSLPLNAILTQQSAHADTLLNRAMTIAEKMACPTIPTVVQAREAGPAIVDEARDAHYSLLFISRIRRRNGIQTSWDKTTFHVLINSLCRVWLVQDPAAS